MHTDRQPDKLTDRYTDRQTGNYEDVYAFLWSVKNKARFKNGRVYVT